MVGRRRLLLVMLGALGLGLVLIVVLVWRASFPPDQDPCGNPAFRQTSLGIGLLAGCIASAMLGRLVVYRLYQPGSTVVILDTDPQLPSPTSARAALWVQAGLVTFLVITAGGLAYETAAVATGKFWAITQYVRCGAYLGPFEALFVAGFVCFFLATWMWYPAGPWPPPWRTLAIGTIALLVAIFAFQFFSELPAGPPPDPLPSYGKWGIVWTAGVILALCGLLVSIDYVFARRGWDAVGTWVVNWTRHYPLWNLIFAITFGAMVGHFFWK